LNSHLFIFIVINLLHSHTAHITGLDAAEKKFGLPENRNVNEKITDYGRDTYEKDTG